MDKPNKNGTYDETGFIAVSISGAITVAAWLFGIIIGATITTAIGRWGLTVCGVEL